MGVACCAKGRNTKSDPQEQSLLGLHNDVNEHASAPQKSPEVNNDTLFLQRAQALKSHNSDVNVRIHLNLEHYGKVWCVQILTRDK